MSNVERFNIEDVVRIHNLRILRRGKDTTCVCPLCGDSRGKFSYFVKKGSKENLWNCFNCNEGGDAIKLHMMITGNTDYQSAIKDIFNIINGNVEFKNKHIDVPKTEKEEEETPKASDEYCSTVYRAMLGFLELRKEHHDNLLKRGFPEDIITWLKFRSTPKDTVGICKKLQGAGYSLEGVPGFYLNKHEEWDLNITGHGFFCPVYDMERNLILGFQIRVDKPIGNAKYLWFSSIGFSKGVGSGSLATYLPGNNDKVIIITEGILKATLIWTLLGGEVTVIGIPGIRVRKCLQSYLQMYENNAFVYEAYDMEKILRPEDMPLYNECLADAKKRGIELDDLLRKDEKDGINKYKAIKKWRNVASAAEDMCAEIHEFGIDTHSLTWDINKDKLWNGNDKGLDDFLAGYEFKDKFLTYILTKANQSLQLKKYFSEQANALNS